MRVSKQQNTNHDNSQTQPLNLCISRLIVLGFLVEPVLSVLKVDGVGNNAHTSEWNTEREDSNKDFIERRLKGRRVLYHCEWKSLSMCTCGTRVCEKKKKFFLRKNNFEVIFWRGISRLEQEFDR